MVFRKRARKNADFHFLIDSQKIDVVQEYTYLGPRMSSSGNFSVSLELLKEKALHALFSLRRHTNLSKLKAALACEIFDTMISLDQTRLPRQSVFFSKSLKKSVKCGVRVLRARSARASHALRARESSHVLEYAKIRTILQSMISPILTYNSEIWGVYLRPGTAHKSRRHTFNFVNDTWR